MIELSDNELQDFIRQSSKGNQLKFKAEKGWYKANLIDQVHSKTISRDFDEQIDAAEQSVGETIHFSFKYRDVEKLVDSAEIYPKETRIRVKNVIAYQMRKYPYLFR